jgi:hypothetical protein
MMPAERTSGGSDDRGRLLVSCIMPTRDRRAFVPRAIRCFRAQDYEPRELVIVDDGDDPVEDLVGDDPMIRYLRVHPAPTLGDKRNRCVEESWGELVMHWDDDDWHAPHRLRTQVDALLVADAELCGLRRMLFHDLARDETWLYEYPAGLLPFLIGGSLLYRRAAWRRAPFPAVRVGEDARFVWRQPAASLVALTDLSLYVATIHTGNTSIRRRRGPYWSRWDGDLAAIVGHDFEPGAAPTGTPREGRVKLNLGSCDAPLAGHVNVDVVPGPGIEPADLTRPWPWPDGAAEHVRAWDIIEHLPDKIHTMNELWRVLAPAGTAEIAVPTTDGPGAFQDPTHVSFWNRRSFLYYEDGNPYRERFARHYGITARFRVLHERVDQSPDGPRLTMLLQAVKP